MARRNWFLECKGVIFSDELLFSLFPTTGHVLRQPNQAFHPDCLQSTVKNNGGFLMTWEVISWKSAGLMIFFMEELTKETIYKF